MIWMYNFFSWEPTSLCSFLDWGVFVTFFYLFCFLIDLFFSNIFDSFQHIDPWILNNYLLYMLAHLNCFQILWYGPMLKLSWHPINWVMTSSFWNVQWCVHFLILIRYFRWYISKINEIISDGVNGRIGGRKLMREVMGDT